MCGRYSLYKYLEQLNTYFEAENRLGSVHASYNAAPSQHLPIVYKSPKHSNRLIDAFSWGLIASNTKDQPSFKPINARAETVDEKWPFVTAYKNAQRCLVPANGFYEWKGKKGHKQPYHIVPVDQPFFAFAGLYDIWIDDNEKPVPTFTIITTAASDKMQYLHNRMPAILLPDEFEWWLNASNEANNDDPEELLTPFSDDGFEYYPVSTDVNSVRNDSEHLVKEIDPDRSNPTLFD